MGAEPLAPGEARRAAEELARGAGAVLLEHASRSFEIDYKSVQDLVTSADRASEAYLVAEIERRYPGHAIVAEEGSGRDRTARYRWLVDPLDGTTNFAHGYPFYAVSVAVEEADAGRESARGPRGAIMAGAVYDPQRDECFSAARGQGASLNGRAIHVSAVSRLERGLLATGFPYDFRERPRESLDAFEAFLHEAQAVRRDGSAALNLCYLACGRFDGFWELKLHPWDTAAAWRIVEEAGGRLSDYAGGPFDPFGIECAGSNRLLHDAVLAVLARFPRPSA
ncbi:MAG TPA: inositol monophosphatase family protein [Candidatus Eisenbacteria bacterium]|nr:inositol monophosphatase family protein [Candidatus Eisenbacteria bacterium]